MANLLKNNSINKMSKKINIDDLLELRDITVAIQALKAPSKGQQKGYYLKSYKVGFDIMKEYLGDMLKWDASVKGRQNLINILQDNKSVYKNEIKSVPTLPNLFKSATKIQRMVKNRVGKIYISIEEIPRAMTILATQKM